MRELLELLATRVRGPVFAYFVLAFVVFNWQPLLFLLVSVESPLNRFAFFDENTSIYSLAVYPLIAATVSALLYPWFQLVILKLNQIPTQIRNNLQATTEHALLLKRLELEEVRAELADIRERRVIEEKQRDEQIEKLTSEERKHEARERIAELRKEKYGGESLGAIQATKETFRRFGIPYDRVVGTGGSTGVRVWVTDEIERDTLDLVHEQIISLHGSPIALDVRDLITDKVKYSSSRPSFLRDRES